jgi:dihydropteroate synthase type 2
MQVRRSTGRAVASPGALRFRAAVPSAGVTIFGIVNLTRDSFSDGGRYLEPAAAIDRAVQLVEDGADVIDLGAASSHPEAESVSAEEEIRRLEPVIGDLVGRGIAVSVDSPLPAVQRFALAAGALYLNDIRGFPDAGFHHELAETAWAHRESNSAASSPRFIVMHSVSGGSRATRPVTEADDVWRHLIEFFDERISTLETAGVPHHHLILDPGMGLFLGVDPEPSVNVLRRLGELRERYDLDVLVSVSRKSLVGRLAGRGVGARDAATLAAELFAVERGASFIRTHEPRLLRDALVVFEALRGPATD